MYICIFSLALQAFEWAREDDTLPTDFPQDAVFGAHRSQPDVHVYFQWLTGVDNVKFTHFEVLAPTNVQNLTGCIVLPKHVDHFQAERVKSSSQRSSFFDAATYQGRNYTFPPLAGRIQSSEQHATMWRPVQPDKIGAIFNADGVEDTSVVSRISVHICKAPCFFLSSFVYGLTFGVICFFMFLYLN